MPPPPLVLVNAVGLTPRLLIHAPRLHALAQQGWVRSLRPPLPAVTCTAQACMLTGRTPREHGIVANGWLFRDTGEVRFWQQSNSLMRAPPVYETALQRARARHRPFRCAKLFWWFNQGAPVALSVTPKPHYGADGNKAFGIWGDPPDVPNRLEKQLGRFPFGSFWGPLAGRPATRWIALCGATVLRDERPDLTLIYLPHLDYDPQRFGPAGCEMQRLVGELDEDCAPILDAARDAGARVWVVSEYGHVDVSQPVLPNRALRQAGLLSVRSGPFGEQLDTFGSRAFAVCDHQLAHVYVASPPDIPRVRALLAGLPGIAGILVGQERAQAQLDHERSGEVILLADPKAWFAYPFWLEDRHAPDYARTVDIHRKPGFDPCELFFDPKLRWPRARVLWRLAQKKLGFRTLLDVVGLDPTIVGGSHGLVPTQPGDMPLVLGDGAAPAQAILAMPAIRELLLEALDLA